MVGNPLPNDSRVSRYCRPTSIGEDGLPLWTAFELRENEDYLSVNWLEYFGELTTTELVNSIRCALSKSLRLSTNGRLALLKVEEIKLIRHEANQSSLLVNHVPLSNDESHAGIFGLAGENQRIAVELRALLSLGDIYLAVE